MPVYPQTNRQFLHRPVFERNSRWAPDRTAVPDLGDAETTRDNVEAFYEYWYEFKVCTLLNFALFLALTRLKIQTYPSLDCSTAKLSKIRRPISRQKMSEQPIIYPKPLKVSLVYRLLAYRLKAAWLYDIFHLL